MEPPEVADADAMDFSALRARARNALIGNSRAKLDDANSPQVAADPEETAVNGPKTASAGKSADLTWGHFALGLAVGTVAGVGLLALVGSLLSYL